MSFHNVPPNGFPDLPDVEELEAVQKDVQNLKTMKAAKADIAPEFSATSNYAVGDMVYHDGTLYKCTTVHEAAAWNADHFAAATVAGKLSELNSNITTLDGRFAVVTGTNASAVDQFTMIAMPTGFNASNTVIIGYTSQFSNTLWYSNNDGLIVDANDVTVYVTVKSAGFAETPVKVVLYKFA